VPCVEGDLAELEKPQRITKPGLLSSAEPLVDEAVLDANELGERVLRLSGALQVREEQIASARGVLPELTGAKRHSSDGYLTQGSPIKRKDYFEEGVPLRSGPMPASERGDELEDRLESAGKGLGSKSPFGLRIEEACNDLGMTVGRLAGLMGVQSGYMARLLRKKPVRGVPKSFQMNLVWFDSMIRILGVRWQWLLFNEKPKHPPGGPPNAQKAGRAIAELDDEAEHPTGVHNEKLITQAEERLVAAGFTSSKPWEWGEAIKRERRAIESAIHSEAYTTKVKAKQAQEVERGQTKIRSQGEKVRKKKAAKEEPPTLPPESDRAASSRRLGRLKVR
jgi:hypothetical protein